MKGCSATLAVGAVPRTRCPSGPQESRPTTPCPAPGSVFSGSGVGEASCGQARRLRRRVSRKFGTALMR